MAIEPQLIGGSIRRFGDSLPKSKKMWYRRIPGERSVMQMGNSRVNKNTMTVPEMRKLLGLHKTDSYWLIHKGLFETEVIGGQIRIDKSSFEQWYENQDHYRKVNGAEPGKQLRKHYYTIREAAEMLAVNEDTFRDIVASQHIPAEVIGNRVRIRCADFDAWYAGQTRYRNPEDRAADQERKDQSITVPEMGRLLGIDSRAAWKIASHRASGLVLIRVADRPRVTLDSFDRWYQGQTEYVKLADLPSEEQEKLELRRQREALLRMIQKGKQFLSIHEAAVFLRLSDYEVRQTAMDDDVLSAKKIGKSWYIPLDSLYRYVEAFGEEQAEASE